MRRIDPARDDTYDAPRIDALLARVVGNASRDRGAGSWRIRLAAAVSTAVLVGTGLALALAGDGGSPLQVLSLAPSAPSPPSFGGHNAPPFAIPSPSRNGVSFVFTVGTLSTKSSFGDVYSFVGPSDPDRATLKVATALRLVQDRSIQTNPGQWEARGKNGTVWSLESERSTPTGVLSWSFDSRLSKCNGVARTTSGRLVPCEVVWGFSDHAASTTKLLAFARPFLSALPTGFGLGTGTRVPRSNVLSYSISIDGSAGASEYLWFSNEGKLLYASGYVGTTRVLGDYPLLSEVEGVTALRSEYGNPGAHRRIVRVNIVSVRQIFTLVTLRGGSTVLVPEFEYVASNGSTFDVSAVQPHYLSSAPA
jgi:hypothetical protein